MSKMAFTVTASFWQLLSTYFWEHTHRLAEGEDEFALDERKLSLLENLQEEVSISCSLLSTESEFIV